MGGKRGGNAVIKCCLGRQSSRPALILSAGAALCLVGAGLLLWARHGAAVFGDTVIAALAWCF